MPDPVAPLHRLHRALDAGDMVRVRMAVAELPQIHLADAARICGIIARSDRETFDRAAVRWLARLCTERPELPLDDLLIACAAMARLGEQESEGVAALRRIAFRRAV